MKWWRSIGNSWPFKGKGVSGPYRELYRQTLDRPEELPKKWMLFKIRESNFSLLGCIVAKESEVDAKSREIYVRYYSFGDLNNHYQAIEISDEEYEDYLSICKSTK